MHQTLVMMPAVPLALPPAPVRERAAFILLAFLIPFALGSCGGGGTPSTTQTTGGAAGSSRNDQATGGATDSAKGGAAAEGSEPSASGGTIAAGTGGQTGGAPESAAGSPGTGEVTTYSGPSCKPLDGPSYEDQSPTIIELEGNIHALEATETGVLFLEHGVGVHRWDEDSHSSELMVPAPPDDAVAHTVCGGLLRVNATHVFFAQDAQLWRAPLAEPAATELLATQEGSLVAVALGPSHAYFVTQSPYTVQRVSLEGGPAELLDDQSEAQQVDVQGDWVYFTSFAEDRVGRIPVAGGAVEWVTEPLSMVAPLEVSSEAIYWGAGLSLMAKPLADASSSVQIGSMGPMSGAGVPEFTRMVLVGQRLIWCDSAQNVGWTTTDGASCALLMRGSWSEHVEDVAANDRFVFATQRSGRMSRLLRFAL